MKAPTFSFAVEMRPARRLLAGGIVLATIFGLLRAETPEGFFAYMLITAAAILPSVMWLRAHAPGVPILQAVAVFNYLYYAIPILRENQGDTSYTIGETFSAAVTVALFLVTASVAWGLVVGSAPRRTHTPYRDVTSVERIRLITFGGLTLGILFQLLLTTDWLAGVGGFFGVVRAIAMTSASIACYLLGNFRARGLLRGEAWGLAVAGISSIVLLSWSSFFLVGGMAYLLAAMLGYVITAKRIPWGVSIAALAVLFILHAGKGEMRERYGYGQFPSVVEVPGLFSEWITDGIGAIAGGEVQQDIIDRASLLYLLLQVQRLTPEYIPYLGGETYALFPQYLVPRFLVPDKTFSQAGLALLNIRYGVQTGVAANTTTIGWGIIPEAFANFGYIGIIGAGVVFGILTAFFTRGSAGAAPLSLGTLLSIAALVSLSNLEADFGYLLTNLWQALVATLLFFLPIKLLTGGSRLRPAARAAIAS